MWEWNKTSKDYLWSEKEMYNEMAMLMIELLDFEG